MVSARRSPRAAGDQAVDYAGHPLHALREGRLPRRMIQLYLGLALYGFSLVLLIRSGLGLDPWDVLHQGIASRLPLTFGTVVIIVSFLVLLAWIPLRQWPGFGTLSNAVVIGLVTDLGLWLISEPSSLPMRIVYMVVAIVGNAIATAAYIGTRLGPGPRDGLMTGLVRRTGRSVRLVRTTIEVSVVVVGWLLGGTVGVGTVAYALGIGPLVQIFLPRLTVPTTPRVPSTPPDG